MVPTSVARAELKDKAPELAEVVSAWRSAERTNTAARIQLGRLCWLRILAAVDGQEPRVAKIRRAEVIRGIQRALRTAGIADDVDRTIKAHAGAVAVGIDTAKKLPWTSVRELARFVEPDDGAGWKLRARREVLAAIVAEAVQQSYSASVIRKRLRALLPPRKRQRSKDPNKSYQSILTRLGELPRHHLETLAAEISRRLQVAKAA